MAFALAVCYPVIFQLCEIPRDFRVKFNVDRVTETPEDEAFELGPAWWAAHYPGDPGHADILEEPLRISLHAYKSREDLCLEGEVEGSFRLACGRCLTRYRAPIRERFRLVLEPAGARVPADPEGAENLAQEGLYLSEDLESGWFRGGEIQLDRFLEEVISLLLPVQPLCRGDCRGLCPRCGVDRNQTGCDCEEVKSPSPFAALEALRKE